MSAYLWIDEAKGDAINLGDPFQLLATFADIERIVGDEYDTFADFFGVPEATMTDEEVDPVWLRAVREQAARLQEQFGDSLPPNARAVLDDLFSSPRSGPAAGLFEGKLLESAPGPPPKPGLVWNDQTHRWRNPQTGEEHEHPAKPARQAAPKVAPVARLARDPGADKKALGAFAAAAPSEAAREVILDAEYNAHRADSVIDRTPDEIRRHTVERLGAAWRDALTHGDTESAAYAAQVLKAFGADLDGPAPGQTTQFNGRLYDSDQSVASGPVRVLRQPVVYRGQTDRGPYEHVAVKGLVEPVGRRESRSIFAPPIFEQLATLREHGSLTTRTVTVHTSDGRTYQRQQRVSADEPEPEGGHREAELHDPDKKDIAAGIDKDLAALPEKVPEGVIAKAKDAALSAAAKVYLWSVQFANSPWMGRVGEVLEAIFDVPSDMAKLGYNPVTTSGTASPQVFDPVKSGLANTLGVGVSGHIVASIASKVLVKAGYWVAKKLSGQASESAEGLDEAITLWADLISQLFAHLAAEFGGSAPDAATVAAHIRDLVKGQL